MSLATELKTSFNQVVEHVSLLKEILQKQDCVASIWSFPKLTNEDVGQQPESIVLTRFAGDQALSKALSHLSSFNNVPSTPGVFGNRIGGTLQVFTESVSEIRQRIERINELKVNFQELILSLHHSVDVRFRLVKEHLPDISKKATTRQILLAPPDTKYVNFSWTQRYSGKKFSKEELVKIIQNAGKRVPPDKDPTDWHQLLEIELKNIINIKHTDVFIQKRPLRISPVANLFVEHNQQKATRQTMIAHSPLIILNQNPEVKELEDFVANSHGIKTDGLMLVLPRKHIYCKTLN